MNERYYTYRDVKLRAPLLRLLNLAGASMNVLGVHKKPTLSPEKLVAFATHRTGLVDLGEDSGIHEALERYVSSAEAEANLNTFGRFAVQNMLVNGLANRLRVIEWAKQHPSVQHESIAKPWVVVGLPRTGTSLLSSLLGLDPNCRPLLQWEARHPIPPADLAAAQEDPRIMQFSRDIERVIKLNPPIAAMHPFGSTLAEECTAVFIYALRTIGMESISFVPGYGQWLDDADMTPAYAIHKTLLQCLQSAQPTERWVLKSPNHLWSLDALRAAYPDARIVWTHRDPSSVVSSLASLNSAMQMQFTRKLNPTRVGEYWAKKIATGMEKAMAFDDASPDNWCCHVQYNDLMSDTAGTINNIYRHFGESPSPLHQRRITAWLRHRPQNVHGRHRYKPEDFGWTRKSLQDRFQNYRKKYQVPISP